MKLCEVGSFFGNTNKIFWDVTYKTVDGLEMSRILPSESEEKIRGFVEKFLGDVIAVVKVDRPKMKAADALDGEKPKLTNPRADQPKMKASEYFDMLKRQELEKKKTETGGRLDESVTFSVAKIKKYDGRDTYDTTEFAKEGSIPCRDCDGNGKYETGVECHYCKGSGKERTWNYDYEHLNVANGNAKTIIDMLGTKHGDEWSGAWKHDELPEIRRKLIRLKNGDTSEWTEDPTDERGAARATKDEDGTDRISRGPRMIGGGRSQAQIDRYVDSLLSIIDFAQKNDAVVCWA